MRAVVFLVGLACVLAAGPATMPAEGVEAGGWLFKPDTPESVLRYAAKMQQIKREAAELEKERAADLKREARDHERNGERNEASAKRNLAKGHEAEARRIMQPDTFLPPPVRAGISPGELAGAGFVRMGLARVAAVVNDDTAVLELLTEPTAAVSGSAGYYSPGRPARPIGCILVKGCNAFRMTDGALAGLAEPVVSTGEIQQVDGFGRLYVVRVFDVESHVVVKPSERRKASR